MKTFVPVVIPDDRKHLFEMMDSGAYALAVLEGLDKQEEDLARLTKMRRAGTTIPHVVALIDRIDPEDVVHVMRSGVDDIIFKPVDNRFIVSRLILAFKIAHNALLQLRQKQQREQRIEHHHQWSSARDEMAQRNDERLMESLFYHLKTGLNQGKGPAVLSGLARVLQQLPKEDDQSIRLDKDMYDAIIESADATDQFLAMVKQVSETLSSRPTEQTISSADIYQLLQETCEELHEKSTIRGHMIVFEESVDALVKGTLTLDPQLLQSAFREALLNAFRFSPPESYISIVFQYSPPWLKISFLNAAMEYEGKTGIPEESERRVFDPFFRVHKTVDERYGTLDQGLGLFHIRSIVKKLGGECRLNNVRGHIGGVRDYVILEMNLPLN